jgi:hypothetical protein
MLVDLGWMFNPRAVESYWTGVNRALAYEERWQASADERKAQRDREWRDGVAFYRALPPVDYEAYRRRMGIE